MNSTSASLLIRVQNQNDSTAWNQFVELYTPLIFFWARKIGLNNSDASDLVQDVLLLLVKKLPLLQYDSTQSFRGWLRTVTLNRWREQQRRKSIPVVNAGTVELQNVKEPTASIEFWEKEYRQQLFARAMDLAQASFEPATWAALQEYVSTGCPAGQVAKKHGLSVWTVYSAKSRLMDRLRRELHGLLE